MPAVLLSRLEQQISAFSPTFDQTKLFVSNLIALLELYSDRTYHASFEIPSSSKMISYRVPAVVIRALELEFRRLAEKQPNEALLVADELWLGKKLELKELGISLLGFVPSGFSNQVMDRICNWAVLCPDGFLLDDLLSKSNKMILRKLPSLWLNNSNKWLKSKDSKLIILGLKSLESLINTETFSDLPQIFNSIHPFFRSFQTDIFPEMLHLFLLLCEKHATETGVFLKQVVLENPSPTTLRFIRKLFPSIPNSQLLSLREVVENASEMTTKSLKQSINNRKTTSKTSRNNTDLLS